MNHVRLDRVAEFVRGVTFKGTDVQEATDSNIDCMRTKNVQRSLDTTDVWSIDKKHVKKEDQFLRRGDVLISSANSWNLVGKCCWVPALERATTFGGFVTVLRPNAAIVDASYLYRWFSSRQVQSVVRSFANQTTNISNLDLKRTAGLEVPLPELQEQRRIAAILDEADDLRAKRRKAIAHLDALTQSIFHSMFGDPVQNPYGLERVSLTEAGRLYSGGTPSKEVAENWNGSTPWFSPKDLKRTRLRDSIDHISPNVPANTSLRLLQAGTVVFVVRGMILAHSFPVALLECEGTINQDLKAIIPVREVVPEFLLACLQAQQKYVVGLVETAAHGTKKVTTETLGKTWVFDVPLELQQTFATRVAAVERLKETHRKHLVELDALFSSLQSRAFKGEL